MLAVLKNEIRYENAYGVNVVVPVETKIKVEFLNDEEVIGTFNDESFEINKEEFLVLQ